MKTIDFYEQLDKDFIARLENVTRTRPAVSEISSFERNMHKFAKHLLKLCDEHGIDITENAK